MSDEILHLDIEVAEDFINGKASSQGPAQSTGTHTLLSDCLLCPDG
jgi:hypothetical protein